MRAGDIDDRALEEPLWTSAERPVVCWPLLGDVRHSGFSHSHPDLEATIVLKGTQEIQYADARLECKSGDMWFAASGEIHAHWTRGRVTNICLAFAPEFLGEVMLGDRHWLAIFAEPPARRPRVSSDEQRSNLLGTGWQMFREAANQSPGWEDALRVHLLHALLTLVREWPSDQRPDVRPGEIAILRPALEMVCRRAKRGYRVAVDDAARACALSRSHFSRTFRRLMGRSFGRFETQTRLAVAAHLLRGTDLPVRDIAIRTGFHDSSHLHHHFVSHYQRTPRAFRTAPVQRGSAG